MKKRQAVIIYFLLALIVCAVSLTSCLGVDENTPPLPVNNSQDRISAGPVELKGLVQEKTEFAGTLSEYSFFVLATTGGSEVILFNQKQRSLGFAEYLDKKVKVQGHYITGSIGWRKIEKKGIQVEDIRVIE